MGDTMTIQFYRMPKGLISGITLKNNNELEQFNMALHSCQNVQNVLKNREKLAENLNIPQHQFVFANQTHSANFYKVMKDDAGKGAFSTDNAIPNTDALYTFESNIVLTSMTADCVPITFYSERDHVIGAIHSGWGGSVKEITYLLFKHLQENETVDLTNIYVHIGYALSCEKFEVDSDVAEKFEQLGYAAPFIEWNESTKKYYIDNQLVVKMQCIRAGVLSENITIDRDCTFKMDEGFSYRQDRACGRHVTFIAQIEE